MPIVSLTDLTVRNLKSPQKGQVTYWDKGLKGFGVRVSQGGTKTWVVMYGPDRKRVSIGRYDVVGLADARAEAKILLAEYTLHKVRPTSMAFDDAKEEYLDICDRKNRPRTTRDYERFLDTYYKYGRRNIADITSREIVLKLNKLNDRPSEKYHAYAVGRSFFRWCVGQSIIERSPMANIPVPTTQQSRARVLTEDEIRAVINSAITCSSPFHRIVALLVCTGQRRGEIASLQWDWIKDGVIEFPPSATKNKRAHAIPYGPVVEHVVDGTPRFDQCKYVFPAARHVSDKTTVFNGWSKAKASFDKECGISDWTLHDLRRTYSSNMARLGVSQVVVEKLLNHVSQGTQSPIAQVYNRYSYISEMRDAVLQWEKYLVNLLEPGL